MFVVIQHKIPSFSWAESESFSILNQAPTLLRLRLVIFSEQFESLVFFQKEVKKQCSSAKGLDEIFCPAAQENDQS